MKFNINDNVKVKLTGFGRNKLREDHHKFWEDVKKRGGSCYPEYVEPIEDEEGYSTWQMWCLMGYLGKYVSMSCIPFETVIILEDKNV
jgi:hypothetical protein